MAKSSCRVTTTTTACGRPRVPDALVPRVGLPAAQGWPRLAAASMQAVAALVIAGGLAAGLAGCAVQVQNLEAAREIERASRPPGSVYVGWRVFQDRCAGCHGEAARGTARGPDLLPRMGALGPRQFVSLVLRRYRWDELPATPRADGADDALVEAMIGRRAGALTMPAWQGEPRVSAHVVDLYAYLTARAEGTQGPERPVR